MWAPHTPLTQKLRRKLPEWLPTEEAEPSAEDTAATSAQGPQQSRFPQRERKQPKQTYKAQAAMASELEPQTYAEAMRAPDAPQWKLAMDEEMASLQENSTWTLEQQPIGVRPIPAKWVFKRKQDALGNRGVRCLDAPESVIQSLLDAPIAEAPYATVRIPCCSFLRVRHSDSLWPFLPQ